MTSRRVAISSGHGLHIRGASGSPVPPQLDEVNEARRIVDRVAETLGCPKFHDNTSTSQSQNLDAIVAWHNKQTRDLDVSVHFNAYDGNAHGTEVLYVSSAGLELATPVCNAICDAGNFTNRGAKKRTDLAFLNGTDETAILIETCFCDNTSDSNSFNANFEAICRAIAEEISGEEFSEGGEPPEQPEVPSPPLVPAQGTVHGLAEGDALNIRASYSSSAPAIGSAENGDVLDVVGEAYNGSTRWLRLQFGDPDGSGVSVFGWASAEYVNVGGQVPPAEQSEWHENITATVFGNNGDEQDSAYPDIDMITGSTKGVSFPYKWRGEPRPTQVEVSGPRGKVVTGIVDVGPWNTDDPDYVLGTARPLAESQYINGTVAQNGRVPSNDAGIDLTKPIADAVGISGLGKVRWRLL